LVLIGGCIVMAGLGVYNVAKIKEGEAAAERQR